MSSSGLNTRIGNLKITDSSSAKKSKTSKLKKKETGKDISESLGPESDEHSSIEITAYSQQSRFHRETFDANNTEIDLKGVNVSIGDREILCDAHLRLKEGVRYGMVGQNGVGKSVLMHVLGNNILVGLPQNVRILHIAQLEEFVSGRTILEELLNADTERVRIIREAEALQNASKASSDASMNITIHNILISRLQSTLTSTEKQAIKQSGQRGHASRQKALSLSSELTTLKNQNPQTYITPKMVNDVMNEIFGAYEALDLDGDEGRAKGILKGLGFRDEDLGKEGRNVGLIGGLSGGWRMRVMLGKALFVNPDVLLLDEPTNHLDLPAILWLQDYLVNGTEGKTVVVVSHDRNFLDAVTDETIIFKDKQLKYHPGNYDDWETNTEEQRRRKTRMKELEMKRKKQIMTSIQKNVSRAKSTGDDKRLGMVASRKKASDDHNSAASKDILTH